MASKKKTAKQKEFDILLKYGDKPDELTKRIRTDDIELIRKYKDKLIWRSIVERKTLTNEFIDEFWEEISTQIPKFEVHPNMHIDFLDKNREYIDWQRFVWSSSGARFSIDFIEKFKYELKHYHNYIINLKNLPPETREYLLHNKDDNDLGEKMQHLSRNADISKSVIEKYKDKLNWYDLSLKSKVLSDPKNFKKYENYINIFAYTSLLEQWFRSDDFFVKRVNVIYNEEFLLKYKNSINWGNVINLNGYRLNKTFKTINIPLDFFVKHRSELPKDAIVLFDEWVKKFKEYKKYKGNRPTSISYTDKYYYLLNEYHIHWEF